MPCHTKKVKILPTLSKNHIILWEKMKIIWKKTIWPSEITSRFLRRERKPAGLVDVFCSNLGITAYTLENYSNFKSKFLFNNGSIFEMDDYFRTRGNSRFNDLSQLINTLSNQDFAGLDNFNKLENLFCMQGLQGSWINAV